MKRLEFLVAIAGAFQQAARPEAALNVLHMAAEIARTIESAEHQTTGLLAAVDTSLEVGAPGLALDILNEALVKARTIDDNFERAKNLSKVAKGFARAGRSDQALTLVRTIRGPLWLEPAQSFDGRG